MRLIDADALKKYCEDGLAESLDMFQTEGYKQLAIAVTKSFIKDIDEQPTIETGREWIPMRFCDADEEDRKRGYEYMIDCPIPDDGEESLVTNGKYVWTDMWLDDDGWVLDSGHDIGELTAWMPLPQPYKPEDET